MTTQVTHETDAYKLHYDRLYGVARFERVSDGAMTLWDTGSDAEMIRGNFESLWLKADRGEITEQRRDEVFNSYAAEFSYEVED